MLCDIAISVESLTKSFKNRIILDDINFTLDRGKYVALVGANGSGKTTIIKCLLDFCSIDSGNIRLFGIDHKKPGARDKLSYLPERFLPPCYLTGKDFLQFMMELHGNDYTTMEANKLINLLGLNPSALDRPVYQYSKGMSQKLGLLSALLNNKDLMIFDEPMSGLDLPTRVLFKRYLLDQKECGRTLFFTTHFLDDIYSLCDGVIILHNGKVRISGTVDECCKAFNTGCLEEVYMACTE